MSTTTIIAATAFSASPAGRYVSDGPFSGERFREEFLVPALSKFDHVIVDMEGMEMPGSSFLDEAFAGLVREHGMTEEQLRRKLKIRSSRASDLARVWRYIGEQAGS